MLFSTIDGNVANSDVTGTGNGGGIYHHTGDFSLLFSTVANNLALPSVPQGSDANGGGLFAADNLHLVGDLINANAASNGAGLYQDTPGNTTITSTLFLANLAGKAGAGIYNLGDLTADYTVLWANVATLGNGGGLFNNIPNGNEVDIRNSTVYGNITVNGNGGGIYNATSGSARTTVSNVTIAHNDATNGSGGGLATPTNGQITLASTTIAGNSAGSGAGGGIASGATNPDQVRLRNTILTDNTSSNTALSGNCVGGIASQDYNLDSGTGCALAGTGDLSNGQAALDSLAPADPLQILQGNFTPSYGLQAGSDAIDAANPAGCYDALNPGNDGLPLVTDQRGQPRVKHGRCDIGSVESDSPMAVSLVGWQATSARAPAAWLWYLLAALLIPLTVITRRVRRAGTQR